MKENFDGEMITPHRFARAGKIVKNSRPIHSMHESRAPVKQSVAWLAKHIQKYVEAVPCPTCGAFTSRPCENVRFSQSKEFNLKETLKRPRRRYYQNQVHKARMREYERVKASRK